MPLLVGIVRPMCINRTRRNNPITGAADGPFFYNPDLTNPPTSVGRFVEATMSEVKWIS
jgi:hypothetical protein